MEWFVFRTKSFDKWWKKTGVSDENWEYFEEALKHFRNVNLPHGVQSKFTFNDSFEGWVVRLPDHVKKIGKSSGYRVVFVLDLEEKNLLLQGIFKRDDLNYKGSTGKYERQFRDLVGDITAEYVANSE